jgi:hypothetical protein
MPAKKPASLKRQGGRPTLYKPEYAKQAYHLALLGATDADMARAFDVSDATIDNWKAQHSEFLGSIKRGKDEADANVAKSLYRRALGYSHPAVKIVTVARGNNMGSDVEQVPYVERYPPDTTAGIFWLKNRRPDKWRDKRDVEHTGTVTHELSNEEREERVLEIVMAAKQRKERGELVS